MKSQDFYWIRENDQYCYVNFQERSYLIITKEDEKLYEFLSNIFCTRLDHLPAELHDFKVARTIQDIYQ